MKIVRFLYCGIEQIGRLDESQIRPFATAGIELDTAARQAAFAGDIPLAALPPIALADVEILPPVRHPGSIRDFLIYPDHLVNASGKPLPATWHDRPGFYFTNPHVLYGHEAIIPGPACRALDFELELGILVGRDLSDAEPDTAASAIAGFTIFNDFSARDLQVREAPLGLGPSKGKDFAHGLGPWLVTADELGGSRSRPEAEVIARVNRTEIGRGRLESMYFDLGEILAYASQDSVVRAGDLVGSGTVTTCCLAEHRNLHGRQSHPWLSEGDRVELEISGIGMLANVIGPSRAERGG